MTKIFRAHRQIVTALTLIGLSAGPLRAASERAPEVAGQFYPASPKALLSLVDRYLKLPSPSVPGETVALLVPHAGLEFSGAASARAYKLIPKGKFDSVIILGSGHRKALAGASLYPGAYSAPGFKAAYDQDLAQTLLAASPLITEDAAAHEKEHAIEVHIPFIVRRLGPVKIVALIINTQDLEVSRTVGMAIASACRGKKVLLIASSDLSHYPSGKDADAVDKTTLESLKFLDPAYFWLTNRLILNRNVPHLKVSYCGEAAVTAVLAAARELGANAVQVLDRINSGDVVSERTYNHVVGYASAAFLKVPGKAPPRALSLSDGEKKELLAAARKSIEEFFIHGRHSPIGLSADPLLNLPAAAGVSLKSADGRLRGRAGDESPQESLLESVARNAISAAVYDANFKPLSAGELKDARLEIFISTAPNQGRWQSSIFSSTSK